MSSHDVVVLDYGFGNVRSAVRALERIGANVSLTADFDAALAADGLVVPGVGAFAACMAGLRAVRGEQIVGRRLAGGRLVLGICVGMQVMFARGVEHGVDAAGIGEWDDVVERLDAPVVPHMGWSPVEVPAGSRLFTGVEHERFYFVHSYAAQTFTKGSDDAGVARPRGFTPPQVTWATHGDVGRGRRPQAVFSEAKEAVDKRSAEHGPAGAPVRFVAAVEDGPLTATQFHPEKSGDAGAQLLLNWLHTL